MKTQINSAKQSVLKTLGFFALCMILSLLANPLYAQESERTVTGVVTSVDGPLLGVSIVLKGTSSGITSNNKGEFTFPVALKENDVLVFSYLGYETAEITIAGDTTYVEPSLKDIPVVIYTALRTKDGPKQAPINN